MKNQRLFSKKIFLLPLAFTFFVLLNSSALAQYFEKITSGELVDIKQRSYSATWADINNNGYDDILILGLGIDDESVLYINNGDGTFTASPNSGITSHMGPSIAATWGDYNNDGYLDVYIANTGNAGEENSVNFLFKNNGDGTFTRITEGDIVTDQAWSLGASWADFNKSGYIDLYVANFDGPNQLYVNNGDGTFTKVESGDLVTDNHASFGAYWADINNNGWPDLFVVNAFGTTLPPDNSCLYINNGDGTFEKVTTGHIVNNLGVSHGASWGDYTNNGFLDLFVSNHDWSDNKVNFLYENNGDGTFTFVEGINVTTDQNTSFGSAWLDVNNNGYLDLVVANNKTSNRHNYFYINNGDGTFTSVENDPVVTDVLRSFGISVSDYNNNGYLDLFSATFSPNQENGFYQNLGGTNNWLKIKLEGVVSNRAAIGARINLWAGGLMQTREVASASGQYSSSSFVQHFGLADNMLVDSIQIIWPSNIVNKYYDIEVNQQLNLLETHTILEATFEVKEDSDVQNPIEGAVISIDGYNDLITDENGMASIELFPGNYTANVFMAGYENTEVSFTLENSDATIEVLLTDLIETPHNLAITTHDLPAGDAMLTWDFGNNGKVFSGFNIYLDGVEVVEHVGETQYLFTGLQPTDYTAGVQAVYTTGASEIVTVDFVIESVLFTITFDVEDEDGNAINDAAITFNGTEYDAGIYEITDVEPGMHSYIVRKDGYFDTEGQVEVVDNDVAVVVVLETDDVSVSDPVSGALLNIFPNPASSVVQIHSSETITEIRLIDMAGQVIFSVGVKNDKYELDVSGFSTGIYLVRVLTLSGVKTMKIQIIKP
jgi:hypothetical protein